MRRPHAVTGDAHPRPREEYLERDADFSVKASLVKDFERQATDAPAPDGHRIDRPWTSARFDIVLALSKDAPDEDVHRIA